MNEHRKQILEMLAAGKLTPEQADKLLAAIEPDRGVPMSEYVGTIGGSGNGAKDSGATTVKTRAKYLRVLMEADESMTGKRGMTTVNVRVPMQLLRAGVRLAALIPQQAHDQLDEALSRHGVPLTLSQIKPENLEELIDHLEDLTVEMNGAEGNKAKVRVFCE
jgi:hypothetical protein